MTKMKIAWNQVKYIADEIVNLWKIIFSRRALNLWLDVPDAVVGRQTKWMATQIGIRQFDKLHDASAFQSFGTYMVLLACRVDATKAITELNNVVIRGKNVGNWIVTTQRVYPVTNTEDISKLGEDYAKEL